jgi:hypothetical protein
LIKEERDRKETLNKGGMCNTGNGQRKLEKEKRERLEVKKQNTKVK